MWQCCHKLAFILGLQRFWLTSLKKFTHTESHRTGLCCKRAVFCMSENEEGLFLYYPCERAWPQTANISELILQHGSALHSVGWREPPDHNGILLWLNHVTYLNQIRWVGQMAMEGLHYSLDGCIHASIGVTYLLPTKSCSSKQRLWFNGAWPWEDSQAVFTKPLQGVSGCTWFLKGKTFTLWKKTKNKISKFVKGIQCGLRIYI